MRVPSLLRTLVVGGLVVAGCTLAQAACDPGGADAADVAQARAAVAAACDCATAATHSAYVRCAADIAAVAVANKSCVGEIRRCASNSTCGRPGAVTCCRTTAAGRTRGSIKRSAAACRAYIGGSACVGDRASLCDACGAGACAPTARRAFQTEFESLDDFAGFYIVPHDHNGSASHEMATDRVHGGDFSHRAWMYATNPVVPGINTNHRGYPTVQVYKRPGGAYGDRVAVELWVWLDVPLESLANKDWVSFATFTTYGDDSWYRSVLVNLANGVVQLVHVPNHGEQLHDIFQTTTVLFPMRRWVQLNVYFDFSSANPYGSPFAMVWQDRKLVSAARFNPRVDPSLIPPSQWPPCLAGWDGQSIEAAEALCGLSYTGRLAQAHFGLYAPPLLSAGQIYNDDLSIRELE